VLAISGVLFVTVHMLIRRLVVIGITREEISRFCTVSLANVLRIQRKPSKPTLRSIG
jgi:hypothetical protein